VSEGIDVNLQWKNMDACYDFYCTRYGPNGKPVCDECEGSATEQDRSPRCAVCTQPARPGSRYCAKHGRRQP
jgi:hypothetical protein